VYCWQKTNLSLLQGEGGPEAAISKSMGKTAHSLWKFIGLGPVSGSLAAGNHNFSAGNQLDCWPRINVFYLLYFLFFF